MQGPGSRPVPALMHTEASCLCHKGFLCCRWSRNSLTHTRSTSQNHQEELWFLESKEACGWFSQAKGMVHPPSLWCLYNVFWLSLTQTQCPRDASEECLGVKKEGVLRSPPFASPLAIIAGSCSFPPLPSFITGAKTPRWSLQARSCHSLIFLEWGQGTLFPENIVP